MKKQRTSSHGSSFEREINTRDNSGNVQIGKFGELFPDLPTYEPTDEAIKKVADIMKENAKNGPGDSDIPAGFAFFGQFIDHDITLEPVSSLESRLDPDALTNFRTPALDLDNVYGPNPDVARHLYDTYGKGTPGSGMPSREHRLPFRLLVEDENVSIDLQRNRQGTAIIGDPRNDENFFISQLHRRMVGFHNEVVKYLEAENEKKSEDLKLNNKEIYEEGRRLVTLHYHWIILHEFLPFIIGEEMTNDIIKNGRKFYNYENNSNRPFIPVEFGGAVYRMGHTLIRDSYKLNDQFESIELFKAPFFGVRPLANFATGIPKEYNIDWKYFVDFGDVTPQFCRKIDAFVALPLFELPFIDPVQDEPISLPERNMRRAKTLKLPSGQAVAEAMGITPLSNKELELSYIDGLDDQAPLWYYVLKEGELQTEGKHLGQVGGRIVGEVLIGIIEATQSKIFESDTDRKNWKPIFGANGTFTLKDLISFNWDER